MNSIINDIETMIEQGVDPTLFPVEKGSKILVGYRTIIEDEDGYTVFNSHKQLILRTRTKVAALAAARNKSFCFQEILRLDKLIDKKVADYAFYEAAKRKSKDQSTLSILMQDNRLHVKDCREKLESFIHKQAK